MDCLKNEFTYHLLSSRCGFEQSDAFAEILNTYASVLFFYIFAGLRGMRIEVLIKKIFFKEIWVADAHRGSVTGNEDSCFISCVNGIEMHHLVFRK